ncbi:MAG TPA: phospholipase D-like domain-containing protein [Nocardioides sp.]|nr:phospholipase D-like domain-containing protein [Nocardioides sp.]
MTVVRRRLGPALAVLLLLAAPACTGARSDEPSAGDPPAGFVAGPYDVRPGPVLGVPVDDPDTQAAEHPVVARLLELVAHTPAGERIRIITRSFSLHPVADALVDAHRRGVSVQVIANRFASKDFRAVAKLADEVGTDRRRDSWIHLSSGSGRGPGTATHQKTWTFTRVGDSRRVVMVGSANLSYYSTQQYSDMYVFVDRRDVWRAFDRDFRDQVGLEAPRGPGFAPVLGTDRAWFFPGWDLTTDPVQAMLRELPSDGLVLRFAMYAWHSERGRRLAGIVADQARAGARVQVIALHIGREIVRTLEDAGVEVHDAAFDNGDDVHSKLSLLAWTDADGVRHRRIVTGSDNFGSASLPRDELVLSIDADRGPAWRRYVRWYDDMVGRAEGEGH